MKYFEGDGYVESILTFTQVTLQELNHKLTALEKSHAQDQIFEVETGGYWNHYPGRVFSGTIEGDSLVALVFINGGKESTFRQDFIEMLEGEIPIAADALTAKKIFILSTSRVNHGMKPFEYKVIEFIHREGFAYIIECGDYNNTHITFALF